jgi:hypothetical protein
MTFYDFLNVFCYAILCKFTRKTRLDTHQFCKLLFETKYVSTKLYEHLIALTSHRHKLIYFLKSKINYSTQWHSMFSFNGIKSWGATWCVHRNLHEHVLQLATIIINSSKESKMREIWHRSCSLLKQYTHVQARQSTQQMPLPCLKTNQ